MFKNLLHSALFLLLFIAFSPVQAQASTSSFDFATYEIAPDTEFDVVISVEGLVNTGGVDFTLNYDPTVITYVNMTPGVLVTPYDPGSYGATTSISANLEELYVSIFTDIDNRVTGDGVLATITFRTNATGGSSAVGLVDMIVLDYDGMVEPLYPTLPADSTVSVTTPDTTPPVISAGSPTGTLSAGTTNTTLSITTNENAVCHYSATADTLFADSDAFTNTSTTSHTTLVSGLTNGTSYTYYVRCEDGTGNANTSDTSISFSVASPTTSSGGGGGGGGSSKDTSAPIKTSILINKGAVKATSATVELTLTARDADKKIYMQISESKSFTGAAWKTFNATSSWTFSAGNGVRTLFARFKDSKDNISDPVSEKITLEEVGAPAYVAPQQQATPVTNTTSNGYSFQVDLGMGAQGTAVVALQKQLRSEGFFTYPTDSGYYGAVTAEAVKKYQSRYGISPTGFVGPMTRAQLNKGGGALQTASTGISLEAFVRLLIALEVISKEKAELALSTIANLH